MTEWQPIETAPKVPHRTVIIAQQREGGYWIVCEAHYVKNARDIDGKLVSAWFGPGDYGDEEFSQPYRPSHWQPMPLPPGQAA